jgi:Zn-dependent protease
MKLLKTAEKYLPLLFWVFIIFAFDTPRFAALTIAAALIHEAGHVFFGALRGQFRLFPSAHPTGFRIKPANFISYKDELILISGGPVLNSIVFLVSFLAFKITGGAFLYDFAFVNLLTAISNLLPIKSYDGYRIAETLILMLKRDSFYTLSVLRAASFAFTSLLSFLSLYFILKIGQGYWIFALFFYSALQDLRKLAEQNVF